MGPFGLGCDAQSSIQHDDANWNRRGVPKAEPDGPISCLSLWRPWGCSSWRRICPCMPCNAYKLPQPAFPPLLNLFGRPPDPHESHSTRLLSGNTGRDRPGSKDAWTFSECFRAAEPASVVQISFSCHPVDERARRPFRFWTCRADGMDDQLEREPSSPLALGKPFDLKPLACRPFATHQTFHGESH